MAGIDYYLVSASRRAHRLRNDRPYVIGREAGVEIQIQDALASRRHAELRFDGRMNWAVVDLGSRNGIYVNGQRVEGTRLLADEDRLQVGGQVFSYMMVPPGSDLGSLSNQAPEISDAVTMGPGVSVAELASQGAAFTGRIEAGGLLELLQFLSQTRKTGRLDLTGLGRLIGSVWVDAGAPRHAGCGGTSGLDGLVQLIGSRLERFAFHADAATPSGVQTISGSAESVLMEAARRLDEHRR